MMVREGAVDLRVNREMLARELLDQLLERGTTRPIAGIPTDPERPALEALHEAIDVRIENVDLLDRPMTLGPRAIGRSPTEVLDFLAEDRAPVQQHLEAVVVGRIVA